MKLCRLEMVNRIADERKALLHRIAIVDAPRETLVEPRYRILIDGERQDEAIHALVRPVLVRELKARIATLDKDLEALGVVVDA